jgi:hypothetical protein
MLTPLAMHSWGCGFCVCVCVCVCKHTIKTHYVHTYIYTHNTYTLVKPNRCVQSYQTVKLYSIAIFPLKNWTDNAINYLKTDQMHLHFSRHLFYTSIPPNSRQILSYVEYRFMVFNWLSTSLFTDTTYIILVRRRSSKH